MHYDKTPVPDLHSLYSALLQSVTQRNVRVADMGGGKERATDKGLESNKTIRIVLVKGRPIKLYCIFVYSVSCQNAATYNLTNYDQSIRRTFGDHRH